MNIKNRRYIFIGTPFLALIIFILFHEIKGNYYRISAEDIHAISLNKDILINPEDIDKLDKEALIIFLSDNYKNTDVLDNHIKKINIVPADLLKRSNIRLYKKHSKSIIIESDNMAIAARAWVILTRKGIKHIKLVDDNDNEKFTGSYNTE